MDVLVADNAVLVAENKNVCMVLTRLSVFVICERHVCECSKKIN